MILPSQTTPRRTALLRGLLSLLILGALLFGIPLLLIALAGSPVPSEVPSSDDVVQVLNRRDDGTLFIGAVKVITWLAWAAFAVSCLAEVAGLIRGRQTRVLPVLGGPQRLAAYLIATIVLGFTTSANAAMATPTPTPSSAPATSSEVTPPSTHKPSPAPTEKKIHVVKPRETLWGIAEDELGNGDRYMEIFKASRHIDQPDGVPALTNPRVIHPGEHLVIPREAAAPSTSSDESAQADKTPPKADPTHEQGSSKPGEQNPSRPPQPSQTPHHSATDRPSAAPSVPTAPEPTVAPTTAHPYSPTTHVTPPAAEEDTSNSALQSALYSGLAASGLVALLATKRMIQQRRRRPGHRIRMPEVMSDSEWDARITQTPQDAELLDQALRTLAGELNAAGVALPHILGVQVEKSMIELTLAEPVPAPLRTKPFEPIGELRWALDSHALGDPDQLQEIPAPYPALVTLGQTEKHTPILVDLEHHGAIGLIGKPSEAEEVLTSLAIELATSRWADHLTVLCVGFVPELPAALSSSRLAHVDTVADALTAVRTHMQDVSESLAEAELSHARHARVTHTAEPAWHPLIVLSALPVAEGDFFLLRSLALKHGALASATLLADPRDAGPEGLALLAAPYAQVDLPRLPRLTLRRVTKPIYDLLIDDFTIANDVESIPDPRWHDVPPEPADLLAHLSEAQPAIPPAPAPSPVSLEPEQPPVEESPEATEPEIEEEPPKESPPAPETSPPSSNAPYVRVLGRIEIEGRDITEIEPGKRSMTVELAAFLRLTPSPSAEQVSRAMGAHRGPWSSSTRASAISRLRGWFSTDDQGRQYVPSQGNRRVYELHEAVGCDWHDFQNLAAQGLNHIANGDLESGEHHLTQAYALVRGRPFASAGGDRYIWAEHLRQEMISSIVDVAHVLALLHIDSGRFPQARTIITKGLDIEPGSEILFRDWFRAEHHAGNRQGLNEAAERLLRNLHDLGLDMEPETAELLDQLLYNPFHHKTFVGSTD